MGQFNDEIGAALCASRAGSLCMTTRGGHSSGSPALRKDFIGWRPRQPRYFATTCGRDAAGSCACKHCGCITHWAPVDKTHDRMGVNARLMAPEVLDQVRVRHLDCRCWPLLRWSP